MEDWGLVEYRGKAWRVQRYDSDFILWDNKGHHIELTQEEFENFCGMKYQEQLLKKKKTEIKDDTYAQFVRKLDELKGKRNDIAPYMEKVICGNSKAYDKAIRAADAILATGLRGEELKIAVEVFSGGDRMEFFNNVKNRSVEMATFVREYVRIRNTTNIHKIDLS